ncbi:MAG: TIM barrel protein [Clostridia bacterium]|nr:TIM barrel protein [Clostridia bacterium]
MITFGVAGNPADFYDKKFKVSEDMPKYLYEMGLDAYEYQCSRGVRVSDEKASRLKEEAFKYDILLSVHAPYYISLSTQEEEKKEKTIQYITDTMQVANKMGATRIVVHAGALLGLEREYAVESSCRLLKKAYDRADELGLGSVTICPETMGKINQLGNSDEIIKMCMVDERLIPTIDFGHLYCRTLGRLNTIAEWERELTKYIDQLGYERMKHFHSHFSKMEYTLKGGEKKHVTFEEQECGPYFEHVLAVLDKLKLEPRIICESAGTQSIDALKMKEMYNMKENIV